MLTDRRAWLKGIGAASFGAGLASCANGTVIGLDKSKRSLDIANSGEPVSLDPHKTEGTWANNIIGNMFIGLTTEDEHSHPVPGMAERWEVSDDGLTWTFFLRDAVWSDGHPCNAHDFEFSFKRILNPATLAQYASFLYPIKNAEAVNRGRMTPDRVGATAIDDHTLEIDLEHPAAYLPQLLKHYTAMPVPKHVVQRFGDAWIHPENVAVNGPYVLRKWWSNYLIHLTRNLRFWENDAVSFEDLYFYPTNDANTMARSVESRERGWATLFASNQVGELRRELPGFVHVAPFLMSQFYAFNTTRPPFNDKRVRLALSMALDRDFIAHEIYKTNEQPAYALVPPHIANYAPTARYTWADQPLAARRAQALSLLREAGYGPNNPLRFELEYRNTGDNPRVAVVAQDDWNKIAPWVVCSPAGVEVQVHYDNLRAKKYQMGDGAWVADFNDARNYLYLFETRSGPYNYSGYSNPAYDQLIAASDKEPDLAHRAALMAQAEQLMLDDAAFCMILFGSSRNLVHPDLVGWGDNPEDIHRARWFGIKT